MALNLNKNLKLYYSIKEVAEMFDLPESTLRYWEQEFPFLKPKTSGPAKIRQYQEKDIMSSTPSYPSAPNSKPSRNNSTPSNKKRGADDESAPLSFILLICYFTSSKTTLTDYQCVSTGCCTHVAKTEITIDNHSPQTTKRKHRKNHKLVTFF